jgi:hypothetical protein
MAGQEASCWRCGSQWASEDTPPSRLRVIAGGLLEHPVAEPAQARTRDDDDGWTNDALVAQLIQHAGSPADPQSATQRSNVP